MFVDGRPMTISIQLIQILISGFREEEKVSLKAICHTTGWPFFKDTFCFSYFVDSDQANVPAK